MEYWHEFARNNLVVIFSTQRSGTHFLISLLQSSPEVFGAGEAFHSRKSTFNYFNHVGIDADTFARLLPPPSIADFCGFLRDCRESKKASATRIVLILMYNQFHRLPPGFAAPLLAASKIIHLVRRNVVRTLVSDELNRSKTTTAAHVRETQEERMLTLSCEGLIDGLGRRATMIERHRSLLVPFDVVEVAYEELASDTEREIQRISDALGLDPFVARTTLHRTNPAPLRDKLLNFHEVRETLRGTEFEAMLEE